MVGRSVSFGDLSQQGDELRGVNEDCAKGKRGKLVGSLGSSKCDLGFAELDLVSQLGVRT